eukprot:scaffold2325_cov105-Isochrysis_galbana.AAC.6
MGGREAEPMRAGACVPVALKLKLGDRSAATCSSSSLSLNEAWIRRRTSSFANSAAVTSAKVTVMAACPSCVGLSATEWSEVDGSIATGQQHAHWFVFHPARDRRQRGAGVARVESRQDLPEAVDKRGRGGRVDARRHPGLVRDEVEAEEEVALPPREAEELGQRARDAPNAAVGGELHRERRRGAAALAHHHRVADDHVERDGATLGELDVVELGEGARRGRPHLAELGL